eukprot:2703175-Heterocapsa_arctica.AAC.1
MGAKVAEGHAGGSSDLHLDVQGHVDAVHAGGSVCRQVVVESQAAFNHSPLAHPLVDRAPHLHSLHALFLAHLGQEHWHLDLHLVQGGASLAGQTVVEVKVDVVVRGLNVEGSSKLLNSGTGLCS